MPLGRREDGRKGVERKGVGRTEGQGRRRVQVSVREKRRRQAGQMKGDSWHSRSATVKVGACFNANPR